MRGRKSRIGSRGRLNKRTADSPERTQTTRGQPTEVVNGRRHAGYWDGAAAARGREKETRRSGTASERADRGGGSSQAEFGDPGRAPKAGCGETGSRL